MTTLKPTAPETLLPIDGIRLGTACAGIKQTQRDDLTIIEIAAGSTCAAVFTQNAFCAAPVQLCRWHLGEAACRYALINSGNANAGTGAAGLQAARDCCHGLAEQAGCAANAVLPFSTGVIGEDLPVHRIIDALPSALQALKPAGWMAAAAAILTTDTVSKGSSRQISVAGTTVSVTGIAKGSGMICPDMATMLAYIATDAAVDEAVLQVCLQHAVDQSFNGITVDGDTSTNDSVLLMATGKADLPRIDRVDSDAFTQLQQAITEVCLDLAEAVVRDGEGATRLIRVQVEGGRDVDECRQVAYTIAHSPLVKTAFFAADPNWGRILAAVGRAGLPDLCIDDVVIFLGTECIVSNGGRAPDYSEQRGAEVMQQEEVPVRVLLGRGNAAATVLSCDFSYDYVRINAEYRT